MRAKRAEWSTHPDDPRIRGQIVLVLVAVAVRYLGRELRWR